VNHTELSAHISAYNPVLHHLFPTAAGNPVMLKALDGLVTIQSLMISYIDDFHLMMIVTLCAIPLAVMLKKPKGRAAAPAAAME
jgi:DHA2 family multidrug resistance protein